MTTQLGFPKELLLIEKKLSEFPHLKGISALPERRADLVCFAKGIHPEHSLFPLLLIECKRGRADKNAKAQVMGYNHFLQAPFVAIAGEKQICLVHPEELSFLPPYSQLMERVSLCN